MEACTTWAVRETRDSPSVRPKECDQFILTFTKQTHKMSRIGGEAILDLVAMQREYATRSLYLTDEFGCRHTRPFTR